VFSRTPTVVLQWGKRWPKDTPEKETLMNSRDFSIENHGNIFLFRMNTLAAVQWVFKNVQSDARVFDVALVVEHRYARDLAVGIVADGLAVR
jgi:hypothetical protein